MLTQTALARAIGRAACLAMLALALAGCAGKAMVHENYDKPASVALPAPAATAVAASVAPVAEARAEANQSGFRLLTLNTNGLMSRLVLADKAERSIDLQYYIFRNDNTGKLLAQHLLAAADRGVRVRMLIDDVTSDEAKPMFDALDAHDNIEVRRFNPFNTHQPNALSRAAQMLLEFRRLNRRMHNKSFIVDNKVAVIGGRNIADDYFDAGDDHNFRDLDLLAVGPVVGQASKSFDAYWNDEASVPAGAYLAAKNSETDIAALRTELNRHANEYAKSDYVQDAAQDLPDGPTADRGGQWFWGTATLVADQPEKIEEGDDRPGLAMAPKIFGLVDAATSDVTMISPYFVPSADEDKLFVKLLDRKTRVRLVTNSLAGTDEPAVHTGYAPHRRLLLEHGAEIYELKPHAGRKLSEAEHGSKAVFGLHAKAIVIDARYTFIGSMNMDQRSKLLNTEMGLVVDSPGLAKATLDFFNTLRQPANAYQVMLSGKDKDGDGQGEGVFLRWKTVEDGKPVVIKHEPEAGVMRRAEVLLLNLLPIDGLL
jgi:putative cardiolipin synthase